MYTHTHTHTHTHSVDSLRRVAQQVLEALAYLNHHRIVHHFLSPHNILFTPDVLYYAYPYMYTCSMWHMVHCVVNW